MRKKEQIMYATIKGTLTENDGVFSGFSDTNYLFLQQVITEENNLEIKIKFITGNDITSSQYPMAWSSVVNGSNRSGGFYISNGKYGIVARDTTDTNYQRTGGTINTNTSYFGKIIFNLATKNFKVGISTDDVNYTYGIDIILSGNLAPMNRYIWFGRAIPDNYYFSGSIDLPNSYIKLGATKYNLQAVVGYTKVGSPTIVDGVVSGFSVDDYLKIDEAFIDTGEDLKFCVWALKTNTNNLPIIGVTNGYSAERPNLSTNSMKFRFKIRSGVSITSNYTISIDTWYKVIFKRTNGVYTLSVYDENNNLLDSVSLESADLIGNGVSQTLAYGYDKSTYNAGFVGSIDIGKSYIVRNGTKYIFTIGA